MTHTSATRDTAALNPLAPQAAKPLDHSSEASAKIAAEPPLSAEPKPRRYGQWAGDPRGRAESLAHCIEEVSDFSGWHFQQCSRKRGHGPDGLYCKQHARRHEARKP